MKSTSKMKASGGADKQGPDRRPSRGSSRNGLSTAELLKKEAARLFSTKSYGDTTTREIADSIGINKASLYHHMETKEELLVDLCLEAVTNIYQDTRAAVEATTEPLPRLKALIGAHLSSQFRDHDIHMTMLFELRVLPPKVQRRIIRHRDKYESFVRSVLDEAVEAGVLRTDIDSRYLALSLLDLLNWSQMWFHPASTLTADELGDLFYTLFIEGAGKAD
ncbi:MAG: TetR/AcrR family transcriptional regulator [Solirubrobacterales bacterium]